MANATVFDSTPTNPGGTGTTITVTLPTHDVGDIIYIEIGNTGNTLWTGNPAGWNRITQINVGTAANGIIGTWFWRKVVSGDTLPLSSPVFTLGATVSRIAFAKTWRGADLEGPFTLPEWSQRSYNTGTANPVRPASITTRAPEMLVNLGYFQRSATSAPDQSGYTQDEEIIISGTLVGNATQKVVADANTALTNQDASPTSGARWAAGIVCVPSSDYPYYRSGSQAFSASATSVTPALPAGTTASDNRGNKELIVLTAQCAGATPTVNTPADWTEITAFAQATSGGTQTRKWWTLYDGTLDRQVNRSGAGEILAYLSTYRNPDQTTPIGNSDAQANASSANGTWPLMTRTATKSTVQITCVADATPTFTPPAPWVERNDSQGVVCADQAFNDIGFVDTGWFTLSTASPNVGGIVEIRSVSSVGSPSVSPSTSPSVSPSLSPSSSESPSISPSASISPSTSVSPSVSPSSSLSPSSSPSPSISPSPSLSPSSSASPSEPATISGTVAWGHVDGVQEDNVRTFTDHWTGTGTISGSGNAELICVGAGEFMESEIIETGTESIELLQNVYAAGDEVLIKYRHGATVEDCEAATWIIYSTSFDSLGFVQVRIESTL